MRPLIKFEKRNMQITTKILIGFLIAILVGSALLSLPIAVVSGTPDYMTALFTSTSAVCVTGLSVVPAFSHWTLFGKIVILMLIQLGGLGIVVLTSFVMLILNKKFSLRDRMLIQGAFGLSSMQDMVIFVKRVIKGTIVVEAIGMFVYMIVFVPRYGIARGIWYSCFHAISAFCNAGIDIMGPNSLMGYSSSALMLFNTAILIILGGIGFVVWWDFVDLWKRVRNKELAPRYFFRNLRTHTKIVLIVNGVLIAAGMLLTFLFEYKNPATIGNMTLPDKLLNSFFQSVTLRTAGFVSFSQTDLTEASVLTGCIFMLIGGSPVGTAGGIKTITVAVLFFSVLSITQGKKETVAFHKTINAGMVRRAMAVTAISISVLLGFTVILLATNEVSLSDGMYEVTNAIATVGLSRNVTPTLNEIGKIVIMICMYLGRVGPLTMFMSFGQRAGKKHKIHYAEANIIVS